MVYAVRYCVNHYIFAICSKKQYEMWILLFHGHFSNDTENENKSNPNINFKLMYMKQSMKSKGFERRLLLIMWGLFLSLSAFAQQISIKGHVVDATGEPVIGASVVEGRTTNGTITDVDGNFSLSVPANSTLTISFVGYKTQTVPVNGKNSLKVTLQEDTEVLDEVVVVGYGTMKKSDLTGAVSSVGVKDIKDSPVANIGQAMQGKGCPVLPGIPPDILLQYPLYLRVILYDRHPDHDRTSLTTPLWNCYGSIIAQSRRVCQVPAPTSFHLQILRYRGVLSLAGVVYSI